jgi:hypothetical protein
MLIMGFDRMTKEKNLLEDLGEDRRMVLKWILKKKVWGV